MPATIELEYEGCRGTIPSSHYSEVESEALFFYGGVYSNFEGGPYHIVSAQPWVPEPYGSDYETVEHFFAASKATTAQDHDIIRTMRGPWDAKRAGRRTPLREDWEEVKYTVMRTGLRVKFSDQEMRVALLSTGNRYIAEDSPTDFIWGCRDRRGGYGGLNLLGKCLMDERAEITNELHVA